MASATVARRLGNASEDALDITQGYFASSSRRITSQTYASGKPISRVPESFRHFASKERDARELVKRGGGHAPCRSTQPRRRDDTPIQPLDALDPKRSSSAVALTILERAMARLRQEFAGLVRTVEFEQLEPT